MRASSLFVASLLLSLFFSCSLSQPENVNEDFLEESPDVQYAILFPDAPDRRFVAGEPVEALVLLTNTGESVFNVTSMVASIRHPYDIRYIIQNFTEREYHQLLRPKEGLSLSYTFSPEMLEERDYGFIASVYYFDPEADIDYGTTVYNGTIDILESPGNFDVQTFFTYLLILGILGLAGFGIYRLALSYGFAWRKRKTQRAPVEYGTKTHVNAVDNEWLQGTAAMDYQKRKAAGRKH